MGLRQSRCTTPLSQGCSQCSMSRRRRRGTSSPRRRIARSSQSSTHRRPRTRRDRSSTFELGAGHVKESASPCRFKRTTSLYQTWFLHYYTGDTHSVCFRGKKSVQMMMETYYPQGIPHDHTHERRRSSTEPNLAVCTIFTLCHHDREQKHREHDDGGAPCVLHFFSLCLPAFRMSTAEAR